MSAKRASLRLLALAALALAAWFALREAVLTDVSVAPVRRGTAALSATGNVTVIPSLDGRVVAPAQGILLKFAHKEGDIVKKGDVIAEIDPGTWPFRLKENELELSRLEQRLSLGSNTDLELGKRRQAHEKNRELAASGRLPTETLEQSRRELEQLEFAISQERGDLKLARDKVLNAIDEIRGELDRRRIKAAYDGVIMAPAVLQGDLVMHGATLCNITSHSKSIKAEVNQDDLDAVRKARRVLVKLFSHPGKTFPGTLSKVLPIGNQGTQRFTVFIDLPDLPADVLSGQTGEASFIADERPDVLLVPRSALLGSDCFVLKGDRLERRHLTLGLTTLSHAEVLTGLAEGEPVVTKDPDLRRDGEKVRAVPAAP